MSVAVLGRICVLRAIERLGVAAVRRGVGHLGRGVGDAGGAPRLLLVLLQTQLDLGVVVDVCRLRSAIIVGAVALRGRLVVVANLIHGALQGLLALSGHIS